MDNEEIKPLLVKCITGEADKTEIELVKEWVCAHPENEQYFAQLYETWHNMLYLQPQVNKDSAYQQFYLLNPKVIYSLLNRAKLQLL
jgi:transmembrane sensor